MLLQDLYLHRFFLQHRFCLHQPAMWAYERRMPAQTHYMIQCNAPLALLALGLVLFCLFAGHLRRSAAIPLPAPSYFFEFVLENLDRFEFGTWKRGEKLFGRPIRRHLAGNLPRWAVGIVPVGWIAACTVLPWSGIENQCFAAANTPTTPRRGFSGNKGF